MAEMADVANGCKWTDTEGDLIANQIEVSFIDCIAAAAADEFLIEDGDGDMVAHHIAPGSGTTQIWVGAPVTGLVATTLTAGAEVLVRKASLRTPMTR